MLAVNAVLQLDPTRTLSLRKRFAGDMSKRFRNLKGDIRASIVKNDAFGLRNTPRILTPAQPGQFEFTRTADQIEAFMDWLKGEQESGLLEIVKRPSSVLRQGIEEPWTNTYIRPAYEKGAISGRAKLSQAGFNLQIGEIGTVSSVFDHPVHVDRAGALYTRVFTDLEGITQAMDTQISRILTDGILTGGGPESLAQEINKTVNGIGLIRARTLARTEIIRAHHLATIQEYRNAGLKEVIVLAEWSTAGDDRVCPICEGFQGAIFKLDEIESMLPAHANCRCTTLPVVPGIEANMIVANYLRAHGINSKIHIHYTVPH